MTSPAPHVADRPTPLAPYFADWSTPEIEHCLRRNAPAHATTWGPCALDCGGIGRGCGPCWSCARAALVARVGEAAAAAVCRGIVGERDAPADSYVCPCGYVGPIDTPCRAGCPAGTDAAAPAERGDE